MAKKKTVKSRTKVKTRAKPRAKAKVKIRVKPAARVSARKPVAFYMQPISVLSEQFDRVIGFFK